MGLLNFLHVNFKPLCNDIEVGLFLNNFLNKKTFSAVGIYHLAKAIHYEKNCGERECNSFVPVFNVMVLSQALTPAFPPKRSIKI